MLRAAVSENIRALAAAAMAPQLGVGADWATASLRSRRYRTTPSRFKRDFEPQKKGLAFYRDLTRSGGPLNHDICRKRQNRDFQIKQGFSNKTGSGN
jgi:hypothetical protein